MALREPLDPQSYSCTVVCNNVFLEFFRLLLLVDFCGCSLDCNGTANRNRTLLDSQSPAGMLVASLILLLRVFDVVLLEVAEDTLLVDSDLRKRLRKLERKAPPLLLWLDLLLLLRKAEEEDTDAMLV